MSLPVVLRPEARNEMDEAYSWYERRRPGLGEAFLAAVEHVFEHIQEYPAMFPEVHRGVRRGVTRRFPYNILCQVDNETDRIVVLAVFHGRCHPSGWQGRA